MYLVSKFIFLTKWRAWVEWCWNWVVHNFAVIWEQSQIFVEMLSIKMLDVNCFSIFMYSTNLNLDLSLKNQLSKNESFYGTIRHKQSKTDWPNFLSKFKFLANFRVKLPYLPKMKCRIILNWIQHKWNFLWHDLAQTTALRFDVYAVLECISGLQRSARTLVKISY